MKTALRNKLKTKIIEVLNAQTSPLTAGELAYLCNSSPRLFRAAKERDNIFDEITKELFEREGRYLCVLMQEVEGEKAGIFISDSKKLFLASLAQRMARVTREITQLQSLYGIAGSNLSQIKLL